MIERAWISPMEAQLVDNLPVGIEWAYEPKWDGFRCIAYRDGGHIELRSKSNQPLTRYFPEVAANLMAVPAEHFVIDCELVVPIDGALSFDSLLQRIHPAQSRVKRLATETPALAIVFDLLGDADGADVLDLPLGERRQRLETFAATNFKGSPGLRLSPMTHSADTAQNWLGKAGGSIDGVMAKRLDEPYRQDARAMRKVKLIRSADCVIGGFRLAEGERAIGSLLLGLYNADGLLDHIGFCSGLKHKERIALLEKLTPLIQPPGFTGKKPGGPSRWSTKRSTEWEPLRAELVVEVSYDHFTGGRFRHGTKLLRWRPDKPPSRCIVAQVAAAPETTDLLGL